MSARTARDARHAAEAARRSAARARKPQPPPRRPHAVDRDAVADAIHQAVCLAGRDQGIGHCDAYAFAGAVGAAFVAAGVAEVATAGALDVCPTAIPVQTNPNARIFPIMKSPRYESYSRV